jgi:hypothetical protein
MADAASKQQTTALFKSTKVKRTRKKKKKKKKKTDKPDWKPDWKPVLCQRTFSLVFRAIFLHS